MTEDSEQKPPEVEVESRRGFLKAAAWALFGLIATLVLVPMVWMLTAVTSRKRGPTYLRVASMDSLPTGQPKGVTFTSELVDAYLRERVTYDVWVIKHSPTSATVYSPICPHLGCHVDWHPERGEFVCPCHNSIFSTDGGVLSGPSPRPMDTLPYKIEGGELLVAWERFEVGVPKKIVV